MPSSNNILFTLVAKDMLSPVVRGAQNTIDRFKKDAATGFGMAAGICFANGFSTAFHLAVNQLKEATRAARDLKEQQTKSDAVFKENAKSVRYFAAEAARSFGMSEREALQAMGTIGNLLEAIGETPKAAAQMSISLAKLSADLSSFNNQPTSEVLRAMNAALVGEAEAEKVDEDRQEDDQQRRSGPHGAAKLGSAVRSGAMVECRANEPARGQPAGSVASPSS